MAHHATEVYFEQSLKGTNSFSFSFYDISACGKSIAWKISRSNLNACEGLARKALNLTLLDKLRSAHNAKAIHQQIHRSVIFNKHPDYRIAMFVASHPEDIHQFRVVWSDDRGQLQMHRGFYVDYSGSLGTLRGPLRFEATVNLDIVRFLGWEQLMKNACGDGGVTPKSICVPSSRIRC